MTVASILLAAMLCIAGVLCIVAAAKNLRWFFSSPGSIFSLIPRNPARIAAALLGCAILAMALTIVRNALSLS